MKWACLRRAALRVVREGRFQTLKMLIFNMKCAFFIDIWRGPLGELSQRGTLKMLIFSMKCAGFIDIEVWAEPLWELSGEGSSRRSKLTTLWFGKKCAVFMFWEEVWGGKLQTLKMLTFNMKCAVSTEIWRRPLGELSVRGGLRRAKCSFLVRNVLFPRRFGRRRTGDCLRGLAQDDQNVHS